MCSFGLVVLRAGGWKGVVVLSGLGQGGEVAILVSDEEEYVYLQIR